MGQGLKYKYLITLKGCADKTEIVAEMTQLEYHVINKISIKSIINSKYDLQPVLIIEPYEQKR